MPDVDLAAVIVRAGVLALRDRGKADRLAYCRQLADDDDARAAAESVDRLAPALTGW